MYLIARTSKDKLTDYFGPFPTESRAFEYASSFEAGSAFQVLPIIVPNCVTVRLNY